MNNLILTIKNFKANRIISTASTASFPLHLFIKKSKLTFLILHDLSKLSGAYFPTLDPWFLSFSHATHLLLLDFPGTPPVLCLLCLEIATSHNPCTHLLYMTGNSSCKVKFSISFLICFHCTMYNPLLEHCFIVICGCLCPFHKIMRTGTMASSSFFP